MNESPSLPILAESKGEKSSEAVALMVSVEEPNGQMEMKRDAMKHDAQVSMVSQATDLSVPHFRLLITFQRTTSAPNDGKFGLCIARSSKDKHLDPMQATHDGHPMGLRVSKQRTAETTSHSNGFSPLQIQQLKLQNSRGIQMSIHDASICRYVDGLYVVLHPHKPYLITIENSIPNMYLRIGMNRKYNNAKKRSLVSDGTILPFSPHQTISLPCIGDIFIPVGSSCKPTGISSETDKMNPSILISSTNTIGLIDDIRPASVCAAALPSNVIAPTRIIPQSTIIDLIASGAHSDSSILHIPNRDETDPMTYISGKCHPKFSRVEIYRREIDDLRQQIRIRQMAIKEEQLLQERETLRLQLQHLTSSHHEGKEANSVVESKALLVEHLPIHIDKAPEELATCQSLMLLSSPSEANTKKRHRNHDVCDDKHDIDIPQDGEIPGKKYSLTSEKLSPSGNPDIDDVEVEHIDVEGERVPFVPIVIEDAIKCVRYFRPRDFDLSKFGDADRKVLVRSDLWVASCDLKNMGLYISRVENPSSALTLYSRSKNSIRSSRKTIQLRRLKMLPKEIILPHLWKFSGPTADFLRCIVKAAMCAPLQDPLRLPETSIPCKRDRTSSPTQFVENFKRDSLSVGPKRKRRKPNIDSQISQEEESLLSSESLSAIPAVTTSPLLSIDKIVSPLLSIDKVVPTLAEPSDVTHDGKVIPPSSSLDKGDGSSELAASTKCDPGTKKDIDFQNTYGDDDDDNGYNYLRKRRVNTRSQFRAACVPAACVPGASALEPRRLKEVAKCDSKLKYNVETNDFVIEVDGKSHTFRYLSTKNVEKDSDGNLPAKFQRCSLWLALADIKAIIGGSISYIDLFKIKIEGFYGKSRVCLVNAKVIYDRLIEAATAPELSHAIFSLLTQELQ